MKTPNLILFAALLFAAAGSAAGIAGSPAISPYSGMQARAIKAMAPERIADILAGKGAGYALAAELNGYPGPRHVMDLAADLALDAGQLRQTRDLFNNMEQQARPLGAALVKLEGELEAMFRSGAIDEARLSAKTAEIGAAEARLRATHLKYHLAMAAILSEQQRAAYGRLRGYGELRPDGGHDGHGMHGGHGGHEDAQ